MFLGVNERYRYLTSYFDHFRIKLENLSSHTALLCDFAPDFFQESNTQKCIPIFLSVCVPFVPFLSIFYVRLLKRDSGTRFFAHRFFASKRAPTFFCCSVTEGFFFYNRCQCQCHQPQPKAKHDRESTNTFKSGVCFFPLIFRQQVMASC